MRRVSASLLMVRVHNDVITATKSLMRFFMTPGRRVATLLYVPVNTFSDYSAVLLNPGRQQRSACPPSCRPGLHGKHYALPRAVGYVCFINLFGSGEPAEIEFILAAVDADDAGESYVARY